MTIQVNNVCGKTNKIGLKQNKIYTCNPSSTEWFFITTDGKFTLWNVNKDWSKLGIMTMKNRRMTYTTEFEIFSDGEN